jgi:hypothetical protein
MDKNMETTTEKKNFATELVFAAAAAAQRINNGYLRKATADNSRKSNAILARSFITKPANLLPEDYEFGNRVRENYKNLLFEFIAGSLRNYLHEAHLTSMMEEIPASGANSTRLISLIAALPNSYLEEQNRKSARENLERLKEHSNPVGLVGQWYTGKVTVVDAIFKIRFRSYAVNVVTASGEILYFFTYDKFVVNSKVEIQGHIKAHYGQTTQLERVSLAPKKAESNG